MNHVKYHGFDDRQTIPGYIVVDWLLSHKPLTFNKHHTKNATRQISYDAIRNYSMGNCIKYLLALNYRDVYGLMFTCAH